MSLVGERDSQLEKKNNKDYKIQEEEPCKDLELERTTNVIIQMSYGSKELVLFEELGRGEEPNEAGSG